jgi:hypothetical protein
MIKEPYKRGWPKTLCREDWDFSTVPEEELEDCTVYEYARELRSISSIMERVRKCRVREPLPAIQAFEEYHKRAKAFRIAGSNSSSLGKESLQTRLHGYYVSLVLFDLAHCNSFPGTPWQGLRRGEKPQFSYTEEARMYMDAQSWTTGAPIALYEFGDLEKASPEALEREKARFAAEDADKVVSGVFLLRSDADPDEVLNIFEGFIRKTLKNARTEKRGRPRSLKPTLNWLMALRLRFACQFFKDAQAKIDSRLINPTDKTIGKYPDGKSFDRACNQAVQEFRNIFLLPTSETPIHYTQGWRR